MAQYNVYLFPVVRVLVRSVEAESQIEAIKKAEESTDLHTMFRDDDRAIEYAEDMDCFEVDEVGDEEYARSRWYDKEYRAL